MSSVGPPFGKGGLNFAGSQDSFLFIIMADTTKRGNQKPGRNNNNSKDKKKSGRKPKPRGKGVVERKTKNRVDSRNSLVGESIQDFKDQVIAEEVDMKMDMDVEEKEDLRPVELRAHPWLIAGTRHRLLEFGIEYVDPKTNLNGSFTYMCIEDEIVEHVAGPIFRVRVGGSLTTVSRDWANYEYVEKASRAILDEFSFEGKVSLTVMCRRAMIALRTYTVPWPGAELDMMARLTSWGFMDELNRHRIRRSKVPINARMANVVMCDWEKNNPVDPIDPDVFSHRMDLLNDAVNQDGVNNRTFRKILKEYWLVLRGFWPAYIAKMVCDTDSWVPVLIAAFLWFIYYGMWAMWRSIVNWWYDREDPLEKDKRVAARLLKLFKDEKQLPAVSLKFAASIQFPRQCSKHVEVPECDPRAKVTPPSNWEEECGVKYIDSFGTGVEGAPLSIPMQCSHDQYNGLRIRFTFLRTECAETCRSWFASARNFVSEFITKGSWRRYSDAEWLIHLKPSRAKKLLAELLPLSLRSVVPVDIFVKLEAYIGKHWTSFKPRIIQGRRLAYQMLVGSYFYSVSKWVATLFNENTGNWIYDSGLTAMKLGSLAERCFTYARVFELDVSNWDGSLNMTMLEFEKWFLNLIPEAHERMPEIKQFWTSVSGVGKNGISFEVPWGRRSGDMWTSCFNSLINLTIVNFVFGPDTLAIAKGDDGFLGTNSNVTIEEIVEIYSRLGMTVKVKEIPHISQLSYCSGFFYHTDLGYKWGLAPFRVLSKLGMNMHKHPAKIHKRLLFGTALSMLPIGNHVPLLGALLRSIVMSGTKSGILPIMPEYEDWRTTSETTDRISWLGYCEYAAAIGWSVGKIIAIEDRFSQLNLSDFPIVLDDPCFLEGFCWEVGCEPQPNTFTYTPREYTPVKPQEPTRPVTISLEPVVEVVKEIPKPVLREISELPLYWMGLVYCGHNLKHSVLIYAPILEELLHELLVMAFGEWGRLIRWVYIGYYELLLYRTFLNFLLHFFFSRFDNFFVRLLLHSSYNYYGTRGLFDVGAASLVRWWNLNRTQNKNKKGNQKPKKNTPKQKPKTKPRSSIGRKLLTGAGSALGGFLGGPIGSKMGDIGATWLSDVLGMGDYEVKDNSLMNSQSGVPTFQGSQHTVRIKHREYLGDVTSSVGFQMYSTYSLNPGVSHTFPWLSKVAQNFQSYKMHGCLFEFNSTSADALNSVNTALGTVVMATQYNSAAPEFLSKAEMEQYEFSCSTRPSKSLIHPIECATGESVMDHLYVRNDTTQAVPPQFYDIGNFQIATVGMQAAATIGELWVTYDVELFKPRIDPGGTWPGQYAHFQNLLPAAGAAFGPIARHGTGPLPCQAVGDFLTFPDSITGGRFLILVAWSGGNVSVNTATFVNLTQLDCFYSAATEYNTIGATDNCWATVVDVNGYLYGGSSLELDIASASPSTAVDVYVVSLPIVGPSP